MPMVYSMAYQPVCGQRTLASLTEFPRRLMCVGSSMHSHPCEILFLSSQVGTVWVNCWLVRDLNVPFGGAKMSGVGREGLKYSLEFYTEVKTICIKH